MPVKPSVYRIMRSGEFTIGTTGQFHCGTSDVLTLRYRVAVVCPSSSLDSRGFLFDQTRVDKWFQAERTTALSCENYAAHCGRGIYRLIRAENAGLAPTSIELSLSPAPYAAEITFMWNASDGPVAPSITVTPLKMERCENGCLDIPVGLFAQGGF